MAEIYTIAEPSESMLSTALESSTDKIDLAADRAGGSLTDGSLGSLATVVSIRQAVFCTEQAIDPAIEWDDYETLATHLLVVDAGRAVGTARLRWLNSEAVKAERVAVRQSDRGEGWGAQLMTALENHAVNAGATQCLLHAQQSVEGFYERQGYRTVSEPFIEAGIPHVKMQQVLSDDSPA